MHAKNTMHAYTIAVVVELPKKIGVNVWTYTGSGAHNEKRRERGGA